MKSKKHLDKLGTELNQMLEELPVLHGIFENTLLKLVKKPGI